MIVGETGSMLTHVDCQASGTADDTEALSLTSFFPVPSAFSSQMTSSIPYAMAVPSGAKIGSGGLMPPKENWTGPALPSAGALWTPAAALKTTVVPSALQCGNDSKPASSEMSTAFEPSGSDTQMS